MSDIEPLRAYAVLDGERLEELWAELDRLRSEVSELRNCAVLSDQENDRLRGQNERLRDDMVAIQWKASVLRELVREALTPGHASWTEWEERAEKALGLTASPPL